MYYQPGKNHDHIIAWLAPDPMMADGGKHKQELCLAGGQQECVTVTLGLDVLALAPRSMPASQLGPSLLQPALLAQLRSMQSLLQACPVGALHSHTKADAGMSRSMVALAACLVCSLRRRVDRGFSPEDCWKTAVCSLNSRCTCQGVHAILKEHAFHRRHACKVLQPCLVAVPFTWHP